MIADRELAELAAAVYREGSPWDYFDHGRDDEICFGIRRLGEIDVVVFRGSITAHDWYEDFRAFPVATRIGTVHAGFYAGIEKMWAEIRSHLSPLAVVTGHSLGAARADILCGLMLADGVMPLRRVVFGEPRPGLADFCRCVAIIQGASYRNADASGHDRVTDVPFELPGDFAFERPTPLIDVCAPPSLIERLDPLFDYHHVQLYQAALSTHH